MRREYPNGFITALRHAARRCQYEAEILDAIDEINRLQAALDATGDTRHLAVESSIRLKDYYSMKLDECRRERDRYMTQARATLAGEVKL